MNPSALNPAIEALQRLAAVGKPGSAEYPASGNVQTRRDVDAAAAIFIANSMHAADTDQIFRLRDPYFYFELI